MALVLRICCGSLNRGTISLVAYRCMIIPAEKEAWIDLVDVHALRPGGGVVAEAIRSIDLGMVHVGRRLTTQQRYEKGDHVERMLTFISVSTYNDATEWIFEHTSPPTKIVTKIRSS